MVKQTRTPYPVNSVAVAMTVNIDSFREMFSKYIFGGILDRHPGLRIGWFEGGTFGYSERSLAAVVDAVGPENAVRVVGGNVRRFLGI
jgi:hypothetical protein